MSNRHVKHASSGEFDAQAYADALKMFQILIDMKIKPGELAFMDGKRLYERFQHSRQLAPKGRFDRHHLSFFRFSTHHLI